MNLANWPWDAPEPHTLTVTVQPEHIDLMRHTNNVVYLQWLEDVAWAHSTHLGLGPNAYTSSGYGLVVRQHELTYVQATRLDEVIVLGTWITQIDKLSLHRHYQFIRAADAVTVFRARSHFVCVDIEGGKLRRMPAAFTQGYTPALSTAPAFSTHS